jgi:hypothetical protein
MYEHHPKFDIVRAPTARDYSSVTLHVAYERKTGKGSTGKDILPITQAALGSIQREHGDAAVDQKVLIVTGKDNANALRGLVRTGFRHVSLAWWNNLDGSNEWDDHAIVLVVSLPYRPDHDYLNVHQALKGPLDAAGLNTPPDLVREFRQSQIAVDLAQAVNRARCRRVVDGAGRCARTDVYLRLPDHDRQISTDRLLDDLREAMPGVRVTDWTIDGKARLKGACRRAAPALLGYVDGMNPGDLAWSKDVRQAISLASVKRKRQWMRIVSDLKDPKSMLTRSLQEQGVVYRTLPRGTDGRLIGALVKGREAAKIAAHR